MIKKECSTCDSWHRDQFCMRVASGIACVVGLVQRIRPEDIPVAGLGKKARDTQVAGDHYKTVAVQPWDVVDTWPLEQRIGYYRGGALKYVMRMGAKDASAQEIAKGKHYLEKLLEVLNENRG